MTDRPTDVITLKMSREDAETFAHAISDVNCWICGYCAGAREDTDPSSVVLLQNARDNLRDLKGKVDYQLADIGIADMKQESAERERIANMTLALKRLRDCKSWGVFSMESVEAFARAGLGEDEA